MKKILVTGGFGFIGGHLVEELVKDPQCFVHVVDNLSSIPIPHEEFLSVIGFPKNLSYSICSIQDYFKNLNCVPIYNEIYHLASPVGAVGVLAQGGRMVKSVVRDSYCLMEFALHHGIRLLDVSTSEVYGGGRDGYCPEDCAKIVPAKTTVRSEYAVAKLAVETALFNMCRIDGLKGVIVRPFNVAGPRQSSRGGFVLPRFIEQSLKGEPITVYGDGTQIRAFTHVKDIVDGILRAMHFGKLGMAYNLGNPQNKMTILFLAEKVKILVESSSQIIFVDPKQLHGPLFEEANDKYPDASLAMNELGWNPKFGVDEVVADALKYYLNYARA